jgi:hypothetical protein
MNPSIADLWEKAQGSYLKAVASEKNDEPSSVVKDYLLNALIFGMAAIGFTNERDCAFTDIYNLCQEIKENKHHVYKSIKLTKKCLNQLVKLLPDDMFLPEIR